MLILFTIINFALILLAILFIIILFTKISKVQQLEQEYRTLIQEAEDTITSYVLELKEENNAFLQKLSNHGGTPSKQENFDTREADLTESDLKDLLTQENIEKEEKNPLVEQKPFEEWNLKDQVKDLHEKGLTSSDIAKKLNKGKTEIELLLKFRQ